MFLTPCTSQLAMSTGKPKVYIVVIRNEVTTWWIVIHFPGSTRCGIHRYGLCSWGAVMKRTRGKLQPSWLFYTFGFRGYVTRSSRAVFLTSITASAKAGESTGVNWPRRRDCTGGSHLAWHIHCVLSEPEHLPLALKEIVILTDYVCARHTNPSVLEHHSLKISAEVHEVRYRALSSYVVSSKSLPNLGPKSCWKLDIVPFA